CYCGQKGRCIAIGAGYNFTCSRTGEEAPWLGRHRRSSKSASGSRSTGTCRPSSDRPSCLKAATRLRVAPNSFLGWPPHCFAGRGWLLFFLSSAEIRVVTVVGANLLHQPLPCLLLGRARGLAHGDLQVGDLALHFFAR